PRHPLPFPTRRLSDLVDVARREGPAVEILEVGGLDTHGACLIGGLYAAAATRGARPSTARRPVGPSACSRSARRRCGGSRGASLDRKSTRLNCSHDQI